MADRAPRHSRIRGVLSVAALLIALVALWVVPLLFAPKIGDEAFPGADAQAVEIVERTGYEPWVTPVFEPGGEVEAGIFALQAAIGAGVLFYVLGRLHGRSQAELSALSGARSGSGSGSADERGGG